MDWKLIQRALSCSLSQRLPDISWIIACTNAAEAEEPLHSRWISPPHALVIDMSNKLH